MNVASPHSAITSAHCLVGVGYTDTLYPRIRHENSVAEAVPIVVRHLHERVSVVSGPGLPELVPAIWRAQVTDERGFARLTVAGLRSVGVPARLGGAGHAEFWDGSKWGATGE